MKRVLALTFAFAACVPAPKKDYTPNEIDEVVELDEIMRIHAKHADPLFSLRDRDAFSEAEYEQMKQAGAMLDATSAKLARDFARGYESGFVDLAQQLGEHARALSAAADAKQAGAAGAAIIGIRDTCRSCHGSYR